MNKITTALENKQHTLAIFCDLRKAFDSCNHKILLTKLQNMGIQGKELEWFKDYLFNRQQYVHIFEWCMQLFINYKNWCTTRFHPWPPIIFNLH